MANGDTPKPTTGPLRRSTLLDVRLDLPSAQEMLDQIRQLPPIQQKLNSGNIKFDAMYEGVITSIEILRAEFFAYYTELKKKAPEELNQKELFYNQRRFDTFQTLLSLLQKFLLFLKKHPSEKQRIARLITTFSEVSELLTHPSSDFEKILQIIESQDFKDLSEEKEDSQAPVPSHDEDEEGFPEEPPSYVQSEYHLGDLPPVADHQVPPEFLRSKIPTHGPERTPTKERKEVKTERFGSVDPEDSTLPPSGSGADEMDFSDVAVADDDAPTLQPTTADALPAQDTRDMTTDDVRAAVDRRASTEIPGSIDKILQRLRTEAPEALAVPESTDPYEIRINNEAHQLNLTERKNGHTEIYIIPLSPRLKGQILEANAQRIVFELLDTEQNHDRYTFTLFSEPLVVQKGKRPAETIWLRIQKGEHTIEERTLRKNLNIPAALKLIFESLVEDPHPIAPEKPSLLSIKDKTLILHKKEIEIPISIPREFSLDILQQDENGFHLQAYNKKTNTYFIVEDSREGTLISVWKDDVLLSQTNQHIGIEDVFKALFKKTTLPSPEEIARKAALNNKFAREQENQERDRAVYEERRALDAAEKGVFEKRRTLNKMALAQGADRAKKYALSENPGEDPLSKKRYRERLEKKRHAPITISVGEDPFALPPLPVDILERNATLRRPDTDPMPKVEEPRESGEARERSPLEFHYDAASNSLTLTEGRYTKTFPFTVPSYFRQIEGEDFILELSYREGITVELLSNDGFINIETIDKETDPPTSRYFGAQELAPYKDRDQSPAPSNATKTLIRMLEQMDIQKNNTLQRRSVTQGTAAQESRARALEGQTAVERQRVEEERQEFERTLRANRRTTADIVSPEESDELSRLLRTDEEIAEEEAARTQEAEASRETHIPVFVQGSICAKGKDRRGAELQHFSSHDTESARFITAGQDAAVYNPRLNLYAVFDGVSSSRAGGEAARACAEFLNQEVTRFLATEPDAADIGKELRLILSLMPDLLSDRNIDGATTGTVTVVYEGIAYTASVGDTRAFIYRPFNREGEQIQELTVDDNQISLAYKEYPKVIAQINAILSNYTGEASDVPDIELPIPDDYSNLEFLKQGLEQRLARGKEKITPVKERQLHAFETILAIFKNYEDLDFIPAEASREVIASFFFLRSFIADGIKPGHKSKIRVTETPLGPYDRLLVESDALGVLTRKQRLQVLETSTSTDDLLDQQSNLLQKSIAKRDFRANLDDATCLCIEARTEQERIEAFDLFEDYLLEVAKAAEGIPHDYTQFYTSYHEYKDAQEQNDIPLARRKLLETIAAAEEYAQAQGAELPEYPVYREPERQRIDLTRLVDQYDWQILIDIEQNFIRDMNRAYSWGSREKVAALMDKQFPFRNTILGESFRNALEAIQVKLQSPELQELLDKQTLLKQQEEDRYLASVQARELEPIEPIDIHNTRFKTDTPPNADTDLKIFKDFERSPYSPPLPTRAEKDTRIIPDGEVKMPPLKKSWLRSAKTRIAAVALSIAQALASPFVEERKPENPDPRTLTPASISMTLHGNGDITQTYYDGKDGQITRDTRLNDIPPEPEALEVTYADKEDAEAPDMARDASHDATIAVPPDGQREIDQQVQRDAPEADMAFAPDRPSALDAGLLVKIQKDIQVPEAASAPASMAPEEELEVTYADENPDATPAAQRVDAAPLAPIPVSEVAPLPASVPASEMARPVEKKEQSWKEVTQEQNAEVLKMHIGKLDEQIQKAKEIEAARKALDAVGKPKEQAPEQKSAATNVSIEQGEGVTQAVLRALKASGVKEEIANQAVVKAAERYAKEGTPLPRFVKLNAPWNYSYDAGKQEITQITEGAAPKAAPETPAYEEAAQQIPQAKIETPAAASPELKSYPDARVGQFTEGQAIRVLNKTTGKYEDYTASYKTKNLAPGSVSLLGEKMTDSGKKVKFQFALTEKVAKERSIDPKKVDFYEKEKIAVQEIDILRDRLIFTGTDGGIISSIFHYLVTHKDMKPTEAFRIASEMEKQRNIPAENKGLTYTGLPNLVHVGDSIIITHERDPETGKDKYFIEAINKQHSQTELPKKEAPPEDDLLLPTDPNWQP